MSGENTNWCQSVIGVVIRNAKVFLARHTYGNGKKYAYNTRRICEFR